MIGQSACEICKKECKPGNRTCGSTECLNARRQIMLSERRERKFQEDLAAAKRDGLVS